MRIPVVVLASVLLFSGCRSGNDAKQQEVARHSESYRANGDYESLNWLATHYLKEGMSLSEVESVLGKSDGVFGEEAPKHRGNYSRKYSSNREAPHGHLLIAHFSEDKLRGWEWASE